MTQTIHLTLVRLAVLGALAAASPAFGQDLFRAGACRIAAGEFDIDRPDPLPPAPVCRLDQGCLPVNWAIAPSMDIEQTLALHRFDEKHPLRIHTSNVNLLRFKVRWTEEVVERSEAFENVAKLLEGVSPILSIVTGFSAAASRGAAARDPLEAWLMGIETANACLLEITGRLIDVVIDEEGTENRQRLSEARQVLATALPILVERRAAFLSTVADEEKTLKDKLDTYSKVAQRHDDFQTRATEFLPVARNALVGETTVLKQEERNSVVVLMGQAIKSDGTAVGQAVSARYFVAWSKPVTYHVGYGYGRLKDFDFKQVRTLSGQDLFAATNAADAKQAADSTDDTAAPEAVAFLTWELWRSGPNERFGAGLTAGTGVQSVGRTLYVGGTLRVFSRLLLTGGLVAARATRGEGAVTDTTTSPGETRTLFSELKERTDRNPFWSVSFKVY